jgi:hypothetical protein
MERPSVQAPDTFYPEAGSHMPLYAAAVKKPKGAIFPVFCTFPAGKGLHPASPCSHDGSPEKIWKNASFSSLSAVPFIFPDQPLPLSAHRLCSPSSSWEKKPEFAQKKRHASVQSRINSRAFVRLFLTLGKNTLDYLSRINK